MRNDTVWQVVAVNRNTGVMDVVQQFETRHIAEQMARRQQESALSEKELKMLRMFEKHPGLKELYNKMKTACEQYDAYFKLVDE